MSERELIEQYIAGWKEGDEKKILGVLSPACIITESHGPTYHGIEKIRAWIEDWISQNNIVDLWDITTFYTCDNVVFFEWNFACSVGNKKHAFLGASIVEIANRKISIMREYRMTHEPFKI